MAENVVDRLEVRIREAGVKLSFHSPSSVDELLDLLDEVEKLLSSVEQSPPHSMLDALSPSMKALTEDRLSRHSDIDVKVAVASCISEMTRITAPEAPYDDDKMKEVFQLIVSSLGDLFDLSSRSYHKRVSILETVAKIRSCVLMLDLDCEGLIVEMFQHFLKAVRSSQSENVISAMEAIMTLVLEESEDISLEMLTPFLSSVKKDNEDAPPDARKLAEKVLENSSDKLELYLRQAVKLLNSSVEDYSQIVATICEGKINLNEHNDENVPRQQLNDESHLGVESCDVAAHVSRWGVESCEAAQGGRLCVESLNEAAQVLAEGSMPATASSVETIHVRKATATEEPCAEEVDPAHHKSPKSVVSNSILENVNEEASVDQASLMEAEHVQLADQLKSTPAADVSDAVKSSKLGIEPEKTVERRESHSIPTEYSAEPSSSSLVNFDREPEELFNDKKTRGNDVCSSPDKVSFNKAALTDKGSDSPQKEIEVEATVSIPSSLGTILAYKSHRKRSARRKSKESLLNGAPSINVASSKALEEAYDSEVRKTQSLSGKKPPSGKVVDNVVPAALNVSKKKAGTTGVAEGKLLQSSKKKLDPGDSGAKSLGHLVRKKGVGASGSKSKLLRQSVKEETIGLRCKSPRKAVKNRNPIDEEANPPRMSNKKSNRRGLESKSSSLVDEEEDASDLEVKPMKLRLRRKSSLNKKSAFKKGDGKSRAIGKSSIGKDIVKSCTEHSEIVSSPKSVTPKSTKGSGKEVPKEETPATSFKRKRTIVEEREIVSPEKLVVKRSTKRSGGMELPEKTPARSSKRRRTPGIRMETVSPPKSATAKSTKDVSKYEMLMEETPVASSKRKQSAGDEQKSEAVNYDRSLVGLKVKVWWPKDHQYYEGAIVSFDPASKKHKVHYSDGMEETLNLKKEKWLNDDTASGDIKYDNTLVGSKIKVWWPKDHQFYGGVIESFDPVTKNHKVLYADGDVEMLNLKKEKWFKDNVTSEAILYDDTLLGEKVKVWWPNDRQFYKGVIESFNPVSKKHKVCYADGEVEILDLKKENWLKDHEDADTNQNLNGSSNICKSKNVKTDSARLRSGKKTQFFPKKSSSHKSKAKSQVSKGGTAKLGSNSKIDTPFKVEDKSQKYSTSSDNDVVSESEEAIDDDDYSVVTPKTINKSKGKTVEANPNINGSGKVKSRLSKQRELEDERTQPRHSSGKIFESNKSSKHGGSRSGKKRKKRFGG